MPTFRSSADTGEPMLSVDEAQQAVLGEVSLMDIEEVDLPDAFGRILREEVCARHDVPRHDNSAMDGYAVLAADVAAAGAGNAVMLEVIEDIPAGALPRSRVVAGTAARIMTGAPLPEGAEAVVPVEQTDAGLASVRVFRAVGPGANVRRRGEDMREGGRVLAPGTLLRAGEIGVLAAVPRPRVRVGRRPGVAILATGNELAEIDGDPPAGKITNSNSYALAALTVEAGGVPMMRGIVPDSLEETTRALEAAVVESDFVVTTGGVSAGAYDFVHAALDVLGAETLFWRVAMKPGKPMLMARLRGRIVFGLPGNPVSSVTAFHLFVGPALRKAAGATSSILPPLVNAIAAAPLSAKGGRRTYLRVRVETRDGVLTVVPMPAQGSHVSTSLVEANGLAILESAMAVEPGQSVSVLLTALPFNGTTHVS